MLSKRCLNGLRTPGPPSVSTNIRHMGRQNVSQRAPVASYSCIITSKALFLQAKRYRMAYNNRNMLLKMVRVQDIVLEYKRHYKIFCVNGKIQD